MAIKAVSVSRSLDWSDASKFQGIRNDVGGKRNVYDRCQGFCNHVTSIFEETGWEVVWTSSTPFEP